jgi:SpoVK/Ycf46/Vps4 family AAA+-type ATPase
VLDRTAPLVARLGELVAHQRAQWRAAEGLGHGLFIGEADVDLALASLQELAADGGGGLPADRPERLQAVFELEDLELAVLVAACAPDLDQRFGLLYAYLHDDVGRRGLSTGLALRIAGRATWDGAARHRLGPEGRLARRRLIELDDDPEVLRRRIRVPERVTAHLLGVDAAPVEVTRARDPLLGGVEAPEAVLDALGSDTALVYVRNAHSSAATVAVAAAADELALPVVHLRLPAASDAAVFADWLRLALREAALQGFVPLFGPVPDDLPARALADLDLASTRVLLFGPGEWDLAWSAATPLSVDAPTLTEVQQRAVWEAGAALAEVELDAAELARLRAGGAEVARGLRRAVVAADVLDLPLDAPLVAEQVRREHAPALERLARRVIPGVRLDDVILPDAALDELAALVERIRNRDRLREQLGVRSRGTSGRGITAMFCGPSGTGKTLSSEAICGELGVDLYVVNLPSVLSKYIGETEQNLERVFAAAEDIPGVLFFDEADAMFGKRSDIGDARDRYANIEVSYLLQRLERFDGIVVLASNLRANLDDAFNRRLDAVITFPAPGEPERRLLWEAHLPPGLPRAAGLDLDFAAARFELSGGTISSAAQSAAHEVLRRDAPLDDGMLARAIAAELEKASRLVQPSDFGAWSEHLDL